MERAVESLAQTVQGLAHITGPHVLARAVAAVTAQKMNNATMELLEKKLIVRSEKVTPITCIIELRQYNADDETTADRVFIETRKLTPEVTEIFMGAENGTQITDPVNKDLRYDVIQLYDVAAQLEREGNS